MPLDTSQPVAFDPHRHRLTGPGYVEPKLDGVRCLLTSGGVLTGVGAFSRNGALLPGASAIVAELGQHLDLAAWVVDGELLHPAGVVAADKQAHGAGDGLSLVVFDLIAAAEWSAKVTRPLRARRDDLLARVKVSPKIQVGVAVEVQDLSHADLLSWRDRFLSRGYEGCVWKQADAGYPFARSADWLKCKASNTIDCRVVAALESRSHPGTLSSLEVELPDGNRSKVGSGFSAARRRDMERWRGLIGHMVEIKFQARGPYGGLRHAWFVRERADLDAPGVSPVPAARRGHLVMFPGGAK